MIQSQVHPDLKQPRTESSRSVKQLQSTVHPKENILRQIFDQILVENKAGNDSHQSSLVSTDEFSECLVVFIPRQFDQSGVTEPFEITPFEITPFEITPFEITDIDVHRFGAKRANCRVSF